MRLRHIEVFHALMITRSATRAAEVLRSSQPTTSRYLADLEREVGFALFDRTGGRLVPTPEAEALFAEVDRSFSGLARIRDVARGIAAFRFDRLRIASISSFALGALAKTLPRFRDRYAEVGLMVHVGTFSEVVANVLSNQCEIGFVAYPVDNPAIRVTPVLDVVAVCAMPSGHRLTALAAITVEDLRGEHLISLGKNVPSGRQVTAMFTACDVPHEVVLETQNAASACAFVKEGLGLAILDPLTVTATLDARMAVRRFRPSIHFPFVAITRADRPLPRVCGALLGVIAEAADQLVPAEGRQ